MLLFFAFLLGPGNKQAREQSPWLLMPCSRACKDLICQLLFTGISHVGNRSTWGCSIGWLHNLSSHRDQQGFLFQGWEVWRAHILFCCRQSGPNDRVSLSSFLFIDLLSFIVLAVPFVSLAFLCVIVFLTYLFVADYRTAVLRQNQVTILLQFSVEINWKYDRIFLV